MNVGSSERGPKF